MPLLLVPCKGNKYVKPYFVGVMNFTASVRKIREVKVSVNIKLDYTEINQLMCTGRYLATHTVRKKTRKYISN